MNPRLFSGASASVVAAVRAASASAGFTMRWALRGKFAASVLAVLAVAVFALPAQLRDEATAAEQLRMILGWTPGAILVVLGAASLWAGCASVPIEAEGKRFSTTRASPAPAFSIFAGRWLGLVAANAVMLAMALFAVWAQARVKVPGSGDPDAVRALLSPSPGALESEAARIRAWAAAPESDPEREAAVMEAVRRDLRSDSLLPVPPGIERRWLFDLPRNGAPRGLRVVFRCLSPYGSTQGVAGLVEVRAGDSAEPLASLVTKPDDYGDATLDVPPGALDSARTVEVRFLNRELRGGPGASALVGWRQSARAFVPAGGIALNLLRAAPALLAVLSLLSALGVAAGCAFSFPVAAFVATAAVAMVLVSGTEAYNPDAAPDEVVHVHVHAHGRSADPTALDRAVEKAANRMGGALRRTLSPLARAAALDRLGDCIAVDSAASWMALAADGLALPLVFGLVGAAALGRREFA